MSAKSPLTRPTSGLAGIEGGSSFKWLRYASPQVSHWCPGRQLYLFPTERRRKMPYPFCNKHPEVKEDRLSFICPLCAHEETRQAAFKEVDDWACGFCTHLDSPGIRWLCNKCRATLSKTLRGGRLPPLDSSPGRHYGLPPDASSRRM